MTQWWTPQGGTYLGAFGGAGIGLLGAIVGPMCGYLVPRNRGRVVVLGSLGFLAMLGVTLLVLAIIALVRDQPYHVWFPLTLMGFVGTTVGMPLFVAMRRRYSAMEQRKMDAELMRKS